MERRLVAGALVAVLAVIAGCGGSSGDTTAVMPRVVGKRLDVAKSDIKRAGIDDEPEILGGGTFGVVKESNWTVCEQLPAAGKSLSDKPRLTVDRSCSDDTDTDTLEPTSTTGASTTSAPAEALTVQNSPDLAALLGGTDCGDTVAAFVRKYQGRTIAFDGNIATMSNHEGAQTRYDLLVYAGDYSETVGAKGPSFQFRDVAVADLHLAGASDTVGQGTNAHFTATVDDFDVDSCLLLLQPVSTLLR